MPQVLSSARRMTSIAQSKVVGPLELLQGQKAQRVAHDDGEPARRVQTTEIIPQPTHRHGEGGHAEIGLGLAATRREPEEIGECLDRLRSVRMCGVGERRDRQQQECKLERTP